MLLVSFVLVAILAVTAGGLVSIDAAALAALGMLALCGVLQPKELVAGFAAEAALAVAASLPWSRACGAAASRTPWAGCCAA